jgi:nicotinamidase-related amidase
MDPLSIDSPETLQQWVFPWPTFDVNWSRTGLLVIDIQNYLANPKSGLTEMLKDRLPDVGEYYDNRSQFVMIPNTRRLIDSFRLHELEVVYTRHGALLPDGRDMINRRRRRDLDAEDSTGRPSMWSAGSFEHQIVDELAPLPGDLVIDKNSSSPFNSTGIDQLLHNMKLETLVIAGAATDMCVETTGRDAADRGYNVIVVEDATATFQEEHHIAALSGLARVFTQVWKTDQVLGSLEDSLNSSLRNEF